VTTFAASRFALAKRYNHSCSSAGFPQGAGAGFAAWFPMALVSFALVTAAGCTSNGDSLRDVLIDRTRCVLNDWITEPATLSVACTFADGFDEDTRTLIGQRLAQELSARSFRLQEPARYLLEIRCEGPWSGLRGFPVTSRYAKVAFFVKLHETTCESVVLDGEADGVVEEGEVYWAASPRRNLSKAIDSAIGKIGRQLISARSEPFRPVVARTERRPRPTLPVRAPSERPNLAVLDFATAQVSDPDTGRALADVCRRVIQESEQFKLINREQMKNILGERDFIALMACEESVCRVQYARLLAADRIVHGRVSRVGGSRVLYLSLTDVGTGEVQANVLAVTEDQGSQLISVVQDKTWDLLLQTVEDQQQTGRR